MPGDARPRGAEVGPEPPSASATVAGWRDTPCFTEAERAALALAEAVTRVRRQGRPGVGRGLERGRPTLSTRRPWPACW
ncbi:hypothetical protein ACRAWD_01670 [Caulobacter segnis]